MTKVRVVETISGPSMTALRAARDESRASLIEICLDEVSDLDVAGAVKGRKTPVIVSCRPTWAGGRFTGSEEERLRVLRQAIDSGAEFVEVESTAERRGLQRTEHTELVLSYHTNDGIPSDLSQRALAMRRETPAPIKLTVKAGSLRECLSLKDAVSGIGPHTTIATSRTGALTRLCPWFFGSSWAYGGSAAPAGLPTNDLLDLYRVEDHSPSTQIYGIVGMPLGHSASPSMHNRGFHALGLDAVYVPIESDDPDEFLTVAEALDIAGCSVTVPMKSLIGSRVPSDERSRRIGAVNTLRRRNGLWEGRNFDAAGFIAPLESRRFPLQGARAVVLGAGGAARAVVWALTESGSRVEVCARRPDRARSVAIEFGADVGTWPPQDGWDLLVNATPVGMSPHVEDSPLDRRSVRGRCVYDLIYNPLETRLLAWARAAGLEVIDGLEMLVSQAVHQFEWWTGRAAPRALFREAVERFIAQPPTAH